MANLCENRLRIEGTEGIRVPRSCLKARRSAKAGERPGASLWEEVAPVPGASRLASGVERSCFGAKRSRKVSKNHVLWMFIFINLAVLSFQGAAHPGAEV